jgi:hypothetical protein
MGLRKSVLEECVEDSVAEGTTLPHRSCYAISPVFCVQKGQEEAPGDRSGGGDSVSGGSGSETVRLRWMRCTRVRRALRCLTR